MKGSTKRASSKVAAHEGLQRAIEHIVATTSAARLFEMYYWLQEPDSLTVVRQLATLPAADRTAVGAFMTQAEGRALSARLRPDGRLVLEVRQTNREGELARRELN